MEHGRAVLHRQRHLAARFGTFTWDANLYQGLLHASGQPWPDRPQLIGTEIDRNASYL